MRFILTVACALVALACPVAASAVVGGNAVKPGSYPFVVAIGDTTGFYCGGTLIERDVVLTAGHCLTDRRTALANLRVTDSIRTLGVTAVYVHPKFDEQSMHYDAALLILERPLTGVRTLPMAISSPLAGTTVSAAGWGKTREDATTTPRSLRSVVLKVGTTTACSRGNTSFGPYFSPSMLCAANPGRDTCSGDSGGPLVSASSGHAALVGITSFGDGCARAGHPGVYTRVSAIRAWAVSQLKLVAAAAAPVA
jgi:trypsin